MSREQQFYLVKEMILSFPSTRLMVHIDNEKKPSPVYSIQLQIEQINNDTMKRVCPRNQVPCQKQNEEYWGSLINKVIKLK
jgi:hypothetical protein